jgi:hypothetical protein
MFYYETKHTERSWSTRRGGRRGNILVGTLLCAICLFGLVYATTTLSSVEMKKSRESIDEVRSKYLAESGVEQTLHFLRDAIKKTSIFHPLQGMKNLFAAAPVINPFIGEPIMDGAAQIGEFTVTMEMIDQTADSVTVVIDSSGYIPVAPVNLPPGERIKSWHGLTVTVHYEIAASKVFDYAYFINNWGWFYGSTIICNGNARSNGQFDAAGYAPWVNCQPTYDKVNWDGVNATCEGYQDDNGDGLQDGLDGGIFSGWDIVNVHNLRGQGSNPDNQHEFQESVPMPNLNDLTHYETLAIAEGGNINIGGNPMSDAVYGDDAGELGNLYLEGTAADPIEITGKVVVRGDVIIHGPVTGKGAIYAGGNIYCPNSIQYVNGPTTPRPVDNTQAQTEQWLTDNWNKDFLGLFAKENVVVGDHTDATWRNHVSGWMNNAMNKSEEDSGEDGIPNTTLGRDGIQGTADDDVLENDGNFTVEYYTQGDFDNGLIPPGRNIGDVIPGTGEDIDGDGQYDPTISLADVDFTVPLDQANWGGNMPVGGIPTYNTIATLQANHLDAVFYTNHAFCYVVQGANSAQVNGALVCRNENIIYGTPDIQFNYDCRLLGGGAGMMKDLLPRGVKPPRFLRWEWLEEDPNRFIQIQP